MKKPLFIDIRHTCSFAVYFSGIAFLVFLAFSILLLWALNRPLFVNYFADIAALSALQEKLPFVLLFTGIIQSTIASLVLFFVSLYWSHAVAGPLIRFRNHLQMVARAQPAGTITFRKMDQLHYLAKAFSRMQNDYKDRRKEFAHYLKQAERIIDEYESLKTSKPQDTDRLKDKREALKSVYEQMNRFFMKEEKA